MLWFLALSSALASPELHLERALVAGERGDLASAFRELKLAGDFQDPDLFQHAVDLSAAAGVLPMLENKEKPETWLDLSDATPAMVALQVNHQLAASPLSVDSWLAVLTEHSEGKWASLKKKTTKKLNKRFETADAVSCYRGRRVLLAWGQSEHQANLCLARNGEDTPPVVLNAKGRIAEEQVISDLVLGKLEPKSLSLQSAQRFLPRALLQARQRSDLKRALLLAESVPGDFGFQRQAVSLLAEMNSDEALSRADALVELALKPAPNNLALLDGGVQQQRLAQALQTRAEIQTHSPKSVADLTFAGLLSADTVTDELAREVRSAHQGALHQRSSKTLQQLVSPTTTYTELGLAVAAQWRSMSDGLAQSELWGQALAPLLVQAANRATDPEERQLLLTLALFFSDTKAPSMLYEQFPGTTEEERFGQLLRIPKETPLREKNLKANYSGPAPIERLQKVVFSKAPAKAATPSGPPAWLSSWRGTTSYGQPVSNKSLLNHTYILSVFSEDCSSCVALLPSLASLARNMRASGFDVTHIALGVDELSSFSRVATMGEHWGTLVHLSHSISPSLPAVFVVDRTGVARLAMEGQIDLVLLRERLKRVVVE